MMYSHINKSDIDDTIKEALTSDTNVSIYNSDLSGYDFSNIKKLKNVSFLGCNLKGCIFSKMIIVRVHFGKSNIQGIDLSGSKVSDISFNSAIVDPNYWDSIITDNDSYFKFVFFKIDRRFPVGNPAWFEPILSPLLDRIYPNDVPSGDFTGYKTCRNCMVILNIPKYTKRVRMANGTIRVSRAEVVKIIPLSEDALHKSLGTISSDYDPSFIYTKGELVKPNKYCLDRWINGPGIHLFDNKDDALLYHLYKQDFLSGSKYLKQDLTIIGSDY